MGDQRRQVGFTRDHSPALNSSPEVDADQAGATSCRRCDVGPGGAGVGGPLKALLQRRAAAALEGGQLTSAQPCVASTSRASATSGAGGGGVGAGVERLAGAVDGKGAPFTFELRCAFVAAHAAKPALARIAAIPNVTRLVISNILTLVLRASRAVRVPGST